MTIKLVDQALNVAITSLIYGSEIWLTCAFSLYVARRISLKAKAQNTALADCVKSPDLAKIQFEATDAAVEKAQLDTALEKPVDKTILAKAVVESSLEVKTQDVKTNVTKPLSLKKKATKKGAIKKAVSEKEIIEKETVGTETVTFQISCEPVNWKLWKVGDLRKASIYRACGVRIRPIGSRKNLPKANLIAQYEQNLKRLTKLPPMVAVEHHKIA